MKDIIINNKTFAIFSGSAETVALSDLCRRLLNVQKASWKQLQDSYGFLDQSDYRTFQRDGFSFRIQYNPGRIISAAAKVDPQSIAQRKCFLCLANLPNSQQGILYREDYIILCNPWPIFPGHLTIANLQHFPQAIERSFTFLLLAAKDMSPGYTLFYNGPQCGASAPDHLHFQAVPTGSMPIERDVADPKNKKIIHEIGDVIIYKALNPERSVIIIEGISIIGIEETFGKLLKAMQLTEQTEPMINVICSYQGDGWRVMIFPRKEFRPSVYFLDGEEQLLISPGAVEMGGFIVTPRKNDFDKLDRENIESIYREVCFNDDALDKLLNKIMQG